MRSLSIYETLRRFSHIIRLTPFRYEDFSAALLAEDQSALFAEVHVQLLKALIREDRQQQTWLGPPDIRDSVYLYLQSIDHSNWPSALSLYLSADPVGNRELIDALSSKNDEFYPFKVGLETRLYVLEQLCDQFLLSNLTREEILNGNQALSKRETTCRSCSKGNGDLISCSNCPATYHLKCSDPPIEYRPDVESGEDPYLCSLCQLNRLDGVSDCLSEEEKSGNLKRHDTIAIDEWGRRYWFIVRRLFSVDENEEDVRYYTTIKEFEQLLDRLKETKHDTELCENLKVLGEEIRRQMKITEGLQASTLKAHKRDDGTYSMQLGQDGTHRCYTNHYSSNPRGKFQDRDLMRSLNNKFCLSALNSFKWYGAIDGSSNTISMTIKTTILKLETTIPSTFIHPCWQSQRLEWIKKLNSARKGTEYGEALSKLERCIKPILFKLSWYESTGFTQLFRSTSTERDEMKKTDRQPRGFERNERVSADFEQSYRLGTMVKFSPKLKPVKHQVWKQKGEEYRLTGLNGWFWLAKSRKVSKPTENLGGKKITLKAKPLETKTESGDCKAEDNGEKNQTVIPTRRCKPKLPPYHDFQTKLGKIRSILVLPQLELRRLARSAGLREVKSFSYSAKQNNYVWPYGMTPRPVLRTCWLYRNQLLQTVQDVSLQLKVLYACIRWDELQVKPPASGYNTIVTDDATIRIELLKKREKLPYLTQSEYLIRKTTIPNEMPEPKKRKNAGSASKLSSNSNNNSINNISNNNDNNNNNNNSNNGTNLNSSMTPSRSGLRARRPVERDEGRGPTRVEQWVPEDQLELWELKQFDEKIERQNALLRERAFREEAEKRRRFEEEKRQNAEQERRKARAQEEAARRARLTSINTYSSLSSSTSAPASANNATITPAKTNRVSMPTAPNQQRPQCPTPQPTPVLRYFRTENGQIIRLPASYLQLGTPLILRHVNPSNPNQTNTYIIRPQAPAPVTTTQPAPATTTTGSSESS